MLDSNSFNFYIIIKSFSPSYIYFLPFSSFFLFFFPPSLPPSLPFLLSLSLSTGVMQLLRPLLLDTVSSIQQTAALALGRLANYNDDLAEAVVKGDILPQLVYSLAEQNVSYYTI